jgi:aryl-alcohol dehydrogenase-like predicted oxidoreductase
LKDDHKFMRPEVLEKVQELQPIAKEAGLSMAALAVAWVLQNSNVSAAIVGASKPEQLVDNATASGVKLNTEILARIDEVLEPVIERDPGKVESFLTRP